MPLPSQVAFDDLTLDEQELACKLCSDPLQVPDDDASNVLRHAAMQQACSGLATCPSAHHRRWQLHNQIRRLQIQRRLVDIGIVRFAARKDDASRRVGLLAAIVFMKREFQLETRRPYSTDDSCETLERVLCHMRRTVDERQTPLVAGLKTITVTRS
jgi:hypothetical protein